MSEHPKPTDPMKALSSPDHPDNDVNVLADDAEVDALAKDIDPSAPILAGEVAV